MSDLIRTINYPLIIFRTVYIMLHTYVQVVTPENQKIKLVCILLRIPRYTIFHSLFFFKGHVLI